jgi:hypothetical protein
MQKRPWEPSFSKHSLMRFNALQNFQLFKYLNLAPALAFLQSTTFMTSRTESGAEFFAVGLYFSLAAGVGILGLLAFEFSRLLAFERNLHAARS